MAPIVLFTGTIFILVPSLIRGELSDPLPSKFVQTYLEKFGYVTDIVGSTGTEPLVLRELQLRAALRAFQRDVGLQETGYADSKTLKYMMKPRCGTPQAPKTRQTHGRVARFVSVGVEWKCARAVPADRKWPDSVLTWRVADPQRVLKPYDAYIVRNAIHRALNEWSTATGGQLRFREQRGEPAPGQRDSHIVIYFAHGKHNDTLPFDGFGGVVAHGFYPTAGMLHFDAAESWTLNMGSGVNLYQTAVHEIGHLLGLAHSADNRAVMFPINRPYDPKYTLADDDIRGVRYLYTPWAWNYCTYGLRAHVRPQFV